jgi:Flp pilus assembly protein TadD
MRVRTRFFVLAFAVVVLSINVWAQDDEVRQGSGLPMRIGENLRAGGVMNVSGRITIEGIEKLKRPPVITVIVNYAGAAGDRAMTNDAGYFLVRNVPRNNVSLIVEVDGIEAVRQLIVAPPMGNARYDFTIPWPPASATDGPPGVISAANLFSRSEKNEALYKDAIAATKGNDAAKALNLFNQLLSAEPKDFVAWTELGTLYFRTNSLDNAEACYFKAIELKKDYGVALLNLGKLYVTRKQYDNAVLVLSNAVKAAPNSAEAHHFLGESYLQAKKGSSAVYHFNEAIRLSPAEKSELHLRLAALYDAGKMKDKAAAEFRLFLTKNPDYAEKAALEQYIKDNGKK